MILIVFILTLFLLLKYLLVIVYPKEQHLHAKDALWWWNLYKKPRHGSIYEAMRTTKAQFNTLLESPSFRTTNIVSTGVYHVLQ